MKRDFNLENLKKFVVQLESELDQGVSINKSWGDIDSLYEYNKNRQIFNRRLQFNPFVIVYCEKAEDVQITFKAAVDNNLPFRVRAGGHDHEGECTGTDTILIDVSRMNTVSYETLNKDTIARIAPGCKFEDLTSELADNGVMIPHGTCATVGISGFTMGGGWGPYTRLHGMACESLVGADILLGNGEIESVDATINDDGSENVPDLLWALRGGGGISYGIVTEFRFLTFKLPDVMYRFQLEWNDSEDPLFFTDDSCNETSKAVTPTLEILKNWEEVIGSDNTEGLLGTNLKINGIHLPEGQKINESVVHNCVMYGYWKGDENSLDQFVATHFNQIPYYRFTKEQPTGANFCSSSPYGKNLMGSWGRESLGKVREKLGLSEGTPLQPDEDNPAPHKITSRLVDNQGLAGEGKDGHMKLLESLSSPLILDGNRELGLFTYVTLGAITGDYYQSKSAVSNSAFPYPDKLYTIQYQCWWNEEDFEKDKFQNNFIYNRVNKALDWIEVCRNAEIPNTSGAFISFKDSSVPTATYFGENHHRLEKIKWAKSKDPLNHFRTRKAVANMVSFTKDRQRTSRINDVVLDQNDLSKITVKYSTADLHSNDSEALFQYTLSIFDDSASPVGRQPVEIFRKIDAATNGCIELELTTPLSKEKKYTVALSVGNESHLNQTLCAYVYISEGNITDYFNEDLTIESIYPSDCGKGLTYIVKAKVLPGVDPKGNGDKIYIYNNSDDHNAILDSVPVGTERTTEGDYITRITTEEAIAGNGKYSFGYYCGSVLGACSSKEYITLNDVE